MKVNIISLFFSTFVFLCINNIIANTNNFSWKGKIISQKTGESIPNAHLIINSLNRRILFVSNSRGLTEINYINYSENDSVVVSAIGFRKDTIACKDIKLLKDIQMLPASYYLSEAIVKPQKIKTNKVGNNALTTFRTCHRGYNNKMAIYLPKDSLDGKILKVRYYLKSFATKESKYMPIGVGLYQKNNDGSFGKSLLDVQIIARLNKGNWLSVDLAEYNIDFPENGVLVAMEILPSEYYINKGYLTDTNTLNQQGCYNTPSIGFTKKPHSKRAIESWQYYQNVGWTNKYCKGRYFLINIEVEQ